jgi:predicted DNA-binding antitoxin AbrB/MazE fold protein
MAITIETTYENGVLKPTQPLPLIPEGSRLWVTLHIAAEEDRARKAYGLLGWTGDPETVRRVALDPEFDVLASMQDQAIIHLASNDTDFDRVPGLTRYAPA